MRMLASTGSAPVYRTVPPSNTNPSTGVPSAASALETSIPAFRARAVDLARLAREEIEHVGVVDDADGREVAGVRQRRSLQRKSRARKIEQGREILRARHDVAVRAQVEDEDVVGECVERRDELAFALGDDAPVEVDEARRPAHNCARLLQPTPRAREELRARRATVRTRDAVICGLRIAVP